MTLTHLGNQIWYTDTIGERPTGIPANAQVMEIPSRRTLYYDGINWNVQETKSYSKYTGYLSGSLVKLRDNDQQSIISSASGTDIAVLLNDAYADSNLFPAVSGYSVQLTEGPFTITESISPPSNTQIIGPGIGKDCLRTGTNNIPAILIAGKERVTVSDILATHSLSSYSTALLKITQSSQDINIDNVYLHDNSFFIGNLSYAANAIELNVSGSAQFLQKIRFNRIFTYGFKNAINVSNTGTGNSYINGIHFTDCDLWLPVKGLELSISANVAFTGNKFTNVDIQGRNSTNFPQANTNYTDTGFDFATNLSGNAQFNTLSNCTVWDLPAGAYFARVGSRAEVYASGCVPDYLTLVTGNGIFERISARSNIPNRISPFTGRVRGTYIPVGTGNQTVAADGLLKHMATVGTNAGIIASNITVNDGKYDEWSTGAVAGQAMFRQSATFVTLGSYKPRFRIKFALQGTQPDANVRFLAGMTARLTVIADDDTFFDTTNAPSIGIVKRPADTVFQIGRNESAAQTAVFSNITGDPAVDTAIHTFEVQYDGANWKYAFGSPDLVDPITYTTVPSDAPGTGNSMGFIFGIMTTATADKRLRIFKVEVDQDK